LFTASGAILAFCYAANLSGVFEVEVDDRTLLEDATNRRRGLQFCS
jgi:hypothetical protein